MRRKACCRKATAEVLTSIDVDVALFRHVVMQAGRCHLHRSHGAASVPLVGPPALWTPLTAPCASQATMLRSQAALLACPALRALTVAPGDPASAHTASQAPTLLLRCAVLNAAGQPTCIPSHSCHSLGCVQLSQAWQTPKLTRIYTHITLPVLLQ